MRTEEEIRNRLNAFKMDLENPEKARISPDNMAKMVPYIHALEWVLDDRTEADEDNEPSETVNSVPQYKEPPELSSPYEEQQLRYQRNDPNEV